MLIVVVYNFWISANTVRLDGVLWLLWTQPNEEQERHGEISIAYLLYICCFINHFCDFENQLFCWKVWFSTHLFFLQCVHNRHGIFSETNNWRWNLLLDKSKLCKTLYEKKLHEQQFVLVDFSFLLFEQLWKKHRCDAVKFLNKPLKLLRRWLSQNSERYDALKVRCSPLSLPL